MAPQKQTEIQANYDRRQREKGLVRVSVWVPKEQANQFKEDAQESVDQFLNGE